MKQVTQIAIAIFLIAIPFLSISQDKDFEKFINQTFEVNLSQATKGSDPSAFLKAFDKSLIWVDINVAIDGRVASKKGDKESLTKRIKFLGSNTNLTVVWKITNTNQVSVRENTLLANFEVDVSLFAKDEVILVGKNMIDVLAKKINDTYVITYISVVQIADKTYKGRCFVGLEKGANSYTTLTSFPNGTAYQTVQNELAIVGNDKLRVVKLDQGEETYYWNTAQGVVSTDKQSKLKIGSASDETSVLLVILKNQNANKCTHMIPSKVSIK